MIEIRKISKNLVIQFSVLMLVVISLVAYGLGATLTLVLNNHLLRMHGDFYGQIIQSLSAASDHEPLFGQPEGIEIKEIAALPHIKGVAVWNAQGEMIQKTGSPVAPHQDDSGQGPKLAAQTIRVAYDRDANSQGSDFIRIYVPVVRPDGNATIGLLETDEDLKSDIGQADSLITLAVAAAGVLLYGSLFMLYFNSYRRQVLVSRRLRQALDSVVFAMSSLSSLRDQETGGHLERTAAYVGLLAAELLRKPEFRKGLSRDFVPAVASVAPLHDIGKVGIDDGILKKPGKLTPEEFEAMKAHCRLGADLLRRAHLKLPFHTSLELAEQITRSHHERWDGKGYPDGFAGRAIPLAARIMAVADVYDALRSERYYKKPIPHAESVETIRAGIGTQFDPEVVQAFLRRADDFAKVFEQEKGEESVDNATTEVQ